MRYFTHYTLVALLFLGAASVALADKINSDYNHGVDFSKYHTYSWEKINTANPFYADRIKESVNRILQSKGWRLVPSGGHAVLFARDRVHHEQEIETDYMDMGGGWGGGWGWGGWGGMGGMDDATTTSTVDVRTGKLVIDVFDAHTKALLWRGAATEDLSDNSGKNSKNLAKDIAKLLKKFPPQ